MELGEPPLFPSITLPEPYLLPIPILEVPRADIPYYKPLVVPPSDLRPPPGIKPDAKDEPPKETPKPQIPVVQPPPFKPPEIQTFGIPGTDIEIPVPSTEIVVTAASTAVVSVGATLVATSVFKHLVSLFKPILKQAWNKMTKKGASSNSSSLSGPPDS
tara:strand:+ start:534 stop:1010 length:477 start_codon:yes stop_codon:yes gene_type:complete